MELNTSIAEMSMAMHQTNFQQSVGVSIMKKTMDMEKQMISDTLQMLDASPAQAFPGDIGAIFDVRA